jgi:CRP-like cAMP-binding protein
MPSLDGYGVLHALQNNAELASIPFIFITAKVKKYDFRTAMDMGADDYLIKPFSGDELLKVVNIHLKKKQVLKKSFSRNMEGLKNFIDELKSLNKNNAFEGKQIIKKFKRKETIFLEGDEAEFLYIVVSGNVKTLKTNYWGKEYITDLYKEGDFFGYLPLIDEHDQNETAVAVDNSEIALISKQDFFDMIHSNSDISDSFIKLLSTNLEIAEEKLMTQAYDSARKKVADALIYVGKKYMAKDNNEISFSMHREDLSAIAGLSPESVSRNLTDLRKEGLINIKNGNVKIPDVKKLENLKW